MHCKCHTQMIAVPDSRDDPDAFDYWWCPRCGRLCYQVGDVNKDERWLEPNGWHKWPEEKPPRLGEEYIIYEPGYIDITYYEAPHEIPGWYGNYDVTHWMERPEPPEEK